MKKLTLIQQSISNICVFGAVLTLNVIALVIKNQSEVFQSISAGISGLTLAISIYLLLGKKELKDEATYETFTYATKISLIFILSSLLLVAILLAFVPLIAISYKAIIMYISTIFIVLYAAVIRSETRGKKRGLCDE